MLIVAFITNFGLPLGLPFAMKPAKKEELKMY
jgi:hypothetical protein